MRSPQDTSELERRILRALCQHTIQPAEWVELDRKLARYAWREPDNAVVYQAIALARSLDSTNWRAHLPAQTTRMGFPDLEWEVFLGPVPGIGPEPDLKHLIQTLESAAD